MKPDPTPTLEELQAMPGALLVPQFGEASNAADFLSSIARASLDAQSIQYTAYIKALERMDWSYPMADDPSAYARGKAMLAEIKKAQLALDPEFVIWNRFAPERCHNGRSYA
jgi:hypothetical protein